MATSFDSTLDKLGITRTAAAAAPKVASAKTTLGQSDFLALLTAQMKNQDPFNPVDNTQMVAQMAQFSSVAGISEMNGTLGKIAAKLGATPASDAMSYVGKTVLVAGDTAYPRAGGGIAGAIDLGDDATSVQVTISDANGQALRNLQLGAQSKGQVAFDWDGKDDGGQPAGSGPYTVTVEAMKSSGTVSAQPLVWAPVESVSLPSGGSPVLTVTGVGQVDPADVRAAS